MRISDWSSDVCSSDLSRSRSARRRSSTIRPSRSMRNARRFEPPQSTPIRPSATVSPGLKGSLAISTAGMEVAEHRAQDRTSVVSGKGRSVLVDLGGPPTIKKKIQNKYKQLDKK